MKNPEPRGLQLELDRLLARLSDRAGERRYVLDAVEGPGGAGAVHRVWDEDLDRPLAMKVLGGTEESGLDPRALQRFLAEAQVTGQLDHPGIVPIHDLGLDSNGQMYFTMKLVEGESLAEVFARVRSGEPSWSSTRALNVLLRVCEAMAYAHERGVVHRDLRPANIMVGRHGEVYVMDWGQAWVSKGADEQAKEHQEEASGCAEDAGLVAKPEGVVEGAPETVAFEQASECSLTVDARSDVHAVGAMLYELLSGEPPDTRHEDGRTPEAALARSPGTLGDKSLDAPAELLSVCEKAMAPEQEDRYADMGGLADDLRAFLENRVVRAHRTGALIELRKWVARNRAVALLSGLLLLALLLLSGLAVWMISTRDEVRAAEELALQERFDELLLEGFLEGVNDNYGKALDAFEQALAARPESVAAAAGLAQAFLDLDQPERMIEVLDRHDSWGGPTHGSTRLRIAALHALGELERAHELEEELRSPSTAVDHFLAGLAIMQASRHPSAESSAEAAGHFRRAVLVSSAPRLEYYSWWASAAARCDKKVECRTVVAAIQAHWPESAEAHLSMGNSLLLIGDLEEAADAFQDAIELKPGSDLYCSLAQTYALMERWEDALPLAELAFELAPDSPRSLSTLAGVLNGLGRREEALELARRAVEGGGEESASRAVHQAILGGIASDLGDLAEARVHLAEATRRDPQDPVLQNNYGWLLWELEDREGAAEAFLRALTVRPSFAQARLNLIEVYLEQGKAEDALHQARQWTELEPESLDAQDRLRKALAALELWEEAIAVCQRCVELAPEDPSTHQNLAANLLGAQRAAEAIDALTESLRLRPNDFDVLRMLGDACYLEGRLEEAVAHYEHALTLGEDAEIVSNFGVVLRLTGRPQEAVAMGRRAVELGGHLAQSHLTLSKALRAVGDLRGAVASYREFMQLLDPAPVRLFRLAELLQLRSDHEGAIDAYRQALILDPEVLDARENLTLHLIEAGRYAEALEEGLELRRLAQRFPEWEGSLDLLIAWSEAGVAAEGEIAGLLAGGSPPEDPDAQRELATVALRTQHFSLADRLFRHLIELEGSEHTLILRELGALAAAQAATPEDRTPEPWRPRGELRATALDWLREEFDEYLRLHEAGALAREELQTAFSRWIWHVGFEALRDPSPIEETSVESRAELDPFWRELASQAGLPTPSSGG